MTAATLLDEQLVSFSTMLTVTDLHGSEQFYVRNSAST